VSALTECPKCGEQVLWSGDASEVNEDDVIVDAYCTADNGCEANWVEVYSHVASQVAVS
jgi:NAD-dependent DNA ligase